MRPARRAVRAMIEDPAVQAWTGPASPPDAAPPARAGVGCPGSCRLDMKAMDPPSGDHTAKLSETPCVPEMTGRASDPSGRIRQICSAWASDDDV